MRIDCIEIRNFRRLIAARIDMSEDTTVLVGANNSGKTSAIRALVRFLKGESFSIYDIPLSHWGRIDALGDLFLSSKDPDAEVHPQWVEILPSLDVWLSVGETELHHVSHLIPTLDWVPAEGIGVRLQLVPKDSKALLEAFSKVRKAAKNLIQQRSPGRPLGEGSIGNDNPPPNQVTGERPFSLWPEGLLDYLKKSMASTMEIRAFMLDPSAKEIPQNGVAQPQALSAKADALDGRPLAGLIRVDEVPADRGFGDLIGRDEESEEGGSSRLGRQQILTAQLRKYYGRHLDPTKAPESADIGALEAIHEAQIAFDGRLRESFKAPLDELQYLGYPGVTNPRLIVSTHLKPVEGLNHQSAVQYDLTPGEETSASSNRLPEQYNGLGYQNLISMVFRLIGFRDDWLNVGKASPGLQIGPGQDVPTPPLHLVLLEEPEAHLHVQVQQVFIRKAYEILRNHASLKESSPLATQLVVSTHSSHVAHEVDFSKMRYFRRRQARNAKEIPTSVVLNLSEVFGRADETARFVSRYLRATHADLFFADGVILAEGAAERILVPHFIRNHFPELHSSYLTLLEVGGSHAHRLAPLIEHLGVNTLIITDLDSVEAEGHHRKVPPAKGEGQQTANNVLKNWHPKRTPIDSLLDLKPEGKEKRYDESFSIRVAYQVPVTFSLPKVAGSHTEIPRTFEDALVLENVELFDHVEGKGLLEKYKAAIEDSNNVEGFRRAMDDALKSGSKAGFALDLLFLEKLEPVRVPAYIREGLEWLQRKLLLRQRELQAEEDGKPARKAERA